MRVRIQAAEWKDHLPGERRLAEILQVGRDTIRLAIQQLEREGVISPAEAGSRRRILVTEFAPAKASKSRSLRIGLLAHRPLEQLPQPVLLEVDQIRRALAGKGGSLEVFAPSWYEHRHPAKRLETFVGEEPCSAWILLRSSEAVQRWFMQSGHPCLIRGYPHEGIDLPHIDVDWEATARHAAGKLWRLGHQRVGILVPTDALRGVAAAVKGALELGEIGFQAFEIVENGTVEGMARALTRALQLKNPPTAFITTRPRQAATALTWLASKGVRVPTDLSIITLAREPFLEHLVPEVTGYSVDPDAVAKQVLRRLSSLIAGNPHPGGNSWITPDVVKGASVAEVRR
ncbi:substrate-binding domain-containing protein [Luteolibacter sp. LG18]|uniref:substrate-binding domain-containing protein n=1 Tax=Luteolibacter sp. LG18 TaxID=2819286 RepID=UPI002B297374|nr:GntR family transcriptional regulator [Luteolibacter sp. LG18]